MSALPPKADVLSLPRGCLLVTLSGHWLHTGNLGMEHLAKACMQGRGVMIDLQAHFGREHIRVGYDDLMRIMEADGVEVEEGDLV